ncbi:oleate hydratase [Clostridium sp. AL.422]|uniref:oleate hydratase n=1 Tax=Clostridium TaxID=1485 RepID=UPI00293DD5EF|nr:MULTISPECIES: oleate hydratase [unclassified Clostridium]MDV4150503.1 oleate hydratase [Clostridium sp. AL.422]
MNNRQKNSKINPLLVVGAIAGAAAVATAAKKIKDNKQKKESFERFSKSFEENGERQVYFVGGGLGSLAGATYLIRDCNFKGENIHIIDGFNIIGASNDGGNATNGFFVSCARKLNEKTYENFWELFRSVPSIDMPGMSVTEEILNFDHFHPTHAQARLIDKQGNKVDVTNMGFNNSDRMALGKLMMMPEERLDDLTIEDWFRDTPHFFTTNFWYMWQTTFAFQKWSSLFEFKRYMERMILEYSSLDTLEGVTRTTYNQYESVILPIKEYLSKQNVDFSIRATVTDIDFKPGEKITATAIHIKDDEGEKVIELKDDDICIMTNGSMTDNATLGDFNTAPEYKTENPLSAKLWEKVARKKMGLGNPIPFFKNPDNTNWESFTVTCKGNKLLKFIEKFSGNTPGSGALMTFRDSNWLMSIVVPAQPHFKNQPMDTTVFWGYGLYTDKVGDYVKKPMKDCTGKEILTELLHHLHFEENMDEIMNSVVNVIPCMMPYIDSQFQPRKMTDRPNVVPEGSTNFAMISQFVEIPDDIVFTEEYSVRAARTAIYTLLDVKHKEVIPVTQYKKDPKIALKAIRKTYS